MKEVVVVEVKDASVLNLSLGSTPVGPPVAIPPGVTSITLLIRDTAGYEQAKEKKAKRRLERDERRKGKGGRGGKGRRKPDEF